MYKKILAAVNEHLNSEISARYALNLARACGARFYLCFIAEKGLPPQDFDRAEEAMKRLLLKAREMEIPVEGITATGSPVQEIQKIVRNQGIQILFAATRREDIQRRFYAGTVARKLSLTLPCSVALVRVVHAGRLRPGKILVPLDARISSILERAYFTAKVAQAFDSKVYVIHTTRPMTRFFHGEIHLTPVEWEKRLPIDIAEFMARIREYGVEPEGRLAPGMTGRSITVEAATKKHDLMIMGASQRSLWSTLVRGNPVEEVLRETPCDLIILNPRHEN